MKNCETCAEFPCLDCMDRHRNRKYWASLIPREGCQLYKPKKARAQSLKSQAKVEAKKLVERYNIVHA